MANPYSGGGVATTGGGQGNWDATSAPINDYTRPTINFCSTGFANCYLMNDATFATLSDKFWDFWESIKHYFTKADDSVISLGKIPIAINDIPYERTTITLATERTGIEARKPMYQFIELDFGSVVIDKYSDSFLDYTDTQVSLYLPYIGTVDLDTNVVMGTTLSLKYVIDVLTGNLEAHVYVDGSLTYMYQGNCMYNIPFTSVNYAQTLESTVRTAALVGKTMASMMV